ncbi:hypothetical protein EHQ81_08455 [Leptospira selangorensis]|uniref:Uncharacterized protein n=1 Tax=Leptospira selangorensis TaxID=2484982 RepID=A0A5F2C6I8_9LEPT|nr:hypothetical protein EHQ81_08455 [Leptospira selangorensis]TGM30461.1 hypothetical protein EHQ82_01360 [Leptospira selangorensis]
MLPLRFELASQLSLGLRHICVCHFVCRANSCHCKRRNTLVVRRNSGRTRLYKIQFLVGK